MKKKTKHYETSANTKRAVAWTAGIGFFVLLAGVWLTAIFMSNLSNTAEENAEPDTTSEVEEVQRTLSGNTIDEDRIAALEQATLILNDARLESTDDFTTLMSALDTDGLKAENIPEGLVEHFRFVDSFETAPERQIHAVQTVLTLSQVSQQFTDGEDIAPLGHDAWSQVHMDNVTGIAYVPMELFTGTPSGYSMTMVYVDGEWKLDAYGLLDAVSTAALVQQNAQNPLSDGSATPAE